MDKIDLHAQRNCLDHGFVRLVDVMGDDSSIVQAARVSYGGGTTEISKDRGLIRHLMRMRHTTPFEMVEFKFHVKLPIFIARQWIRHRTANVNELSARYSVMDDEMYMPKSAQLQEQSTDNKQGRSNVLLDPASSEAVLRDMHIIQKRSYDSYEFALEQGLTRELARVNLPLSMYTQWYWKIDLHNLFNFLRLRLDSHAQYEIRVYAAHMAQIVKEVTPLAYEAFEDYILNAVSFSHPELKLLKEAISSVDLEGLKKRGLPPREVRELVAKIEYIKSRKV